MCASADFGVPGANELRISRRRDGQRECSRALEVLRVGKELFAVLVRVVGVLQGDCRKWQQFAHRCVVMRDLLGWSEGRQTGCRLHRGKREGRRRAADLVEIDHRANGFALVVRQALQYTRRTRRGPCVR